MKYMTRSVVVMALLSQANAFRPIPGTVPWDKAVSRPSWENPDYPTNYFVPNFGEDHEIKLSKMNLQRAEEEVGHTMKASFDKAKPPADYRVPDFGVDSEVKNLQSSLGAAEKQLGRTWNLSLL